MTAIIAALVGAVAVVAGAFISERLQRNRVRRDAAVAAYAEFISITYRVFSRMETKVDLAKRSIFDLRGQPSLQQEFVHITTLLLLIRLSSPGRRAKAKRIREATLTLSSQLDKALDQFLESGITPSATPTITNMGIALATALDIKQERFAKSKLG